MIKKLRKRFILLALAVVAAVIVVIVAGIDVANYLDMKSDADETIAYLELTNGFAQNAEAQQGGMPPADAPQDGPQQGFPQEGGRQEGPGREVERPKNIPIETMFSARYFTVDLDEDGNAKVDLSRISVEFSKEELEALLSDVSGESGFVGNYRYLCRQTDNGCHYFFLDCEKEIAATRSFIVSSAIITAIGLAVIALLIILLSKKVLAPVEESYQKQKQFITDAGHELKTPLTVIGANAELLELEIGEDNEWLKSIKGQVQRMNKLTKELVFLSRMDEAEGDLPKAPFSLKSALEECADGFKEAALVAGKTIEVTAEELTVNASEEMIRRTLTLLLDNAVKYAQGPTIDLALRKDGKWAILEESNDASLPKGEHPELFERFYRPDESRNTATGGHGIGLSVVKSIVEAHGGEVRCESDGTRVTFRLSLPLCKD